MSTEPSIKLIKKKERKGPEPQTEVKRAVDANRWSKAVQSWVSEFQEQRRDESLPAFHRLFK